MTLQGLAVLVLAFGDIGFDRPGRFGLDFDHGVFFVLMWLGSACMGFLIAWGMKNSGPLRLQCSVVGLAALIMLIFSRG